MLEKGDPGIFISLTLYSLYWHNFPDIFRPQNHSGEFTGHRFIPSQRPLTRSFDVFFDLHLNKSLSKQSWCWWFETPSHSLWRHRNGLIFNWWIWTRTLDTYHWYQKEYFAENVAVCVNDDPISVLVALTECFHCYETRVVFCNMNSPYLTIETYLSQSINTNSNNKNWFCFRNLCWWIETNLFPLSTTVNACCSHFSSKYRISHGYGDSFVAFCFVVAWWALGGFISKHDCMYFLGYPIL